MTTAEALLSPLWCANDEPHGYHRKRNEFGGWNECTGRPTLRGAAMTTAADVENAWIKYRVESKDAEFGTYVERRAFDRYFTVVQAYRKEHAS